MTPDFKAGIAEGFARAIFGVGIMVEGPDKEQTIDDIGAWLHVNGGDKFVTQLAIAIKLAERRTALAKKAVRL